MNKPNDFKLKAPCVISMAVYFTDGEQVGKAEITMGNGNFPTEEEFRERMAEFEKNEMPEGFSLMNKSEFFNSLIPPQYEDDGDGKRHRIVFATPGGEEWDE